MTTVGFKQIMFMLLRERSGCLADSRPGLGGGGGPSEWLLGAGFAEGRNCSGPAGFTLYSYSVIVTLFFSFNLTKGLSVLSFKNSQLLVSLIFSIVFLVSIFIYLFIFIFIFGCVGSSFLCEGFL